MKDTIKQLPAAKTTVTSWSREASLNSQGSGRAKRLPSRTNSVDYKLLEAENKFKDQNIIKLKL